MRSQLRSSADAEPRDGARLSSASTPPPAESDIPPLPPKATLSTVLNPARDLNSVKVLQKRPKNAAGEWKVRATFGDKWDTSVEVRFYRIVLKSIPDAQESAALRTNRRVSGVMNKRQHTSIMSSSRGS